MNQIQTKADAFGADTSALFADQKPRKGQEVLYFGGRHGIVERVEENLCYVRYHSNNEVLPFIWHFVSQPHLNAFHDWPTKRDARFAK